MQASCVIQVGCECVCCVCIWMSGKKSERLMHEEIKNKRSKKTFAGSTLSLCFWCCCCSSIRANHEQYFLMHHTHTHTESSVVCVAFAFHWFEQTYFFSLFDCWPAKKSFFPLFLWAAGNEFDGTTRSRRRRRRNKEQAELICLSFYCQATIEVSSSSKRVICCCWQTTWFCVSCLSVWAAAAAAAAGAANKKNINSRRVF